MNKKICLCAAAALALASCSNDEVVEMAKGDGISFRTVAGLNTRGAETTTASVQTSGVYVTTFKTDGSVMYPETKYTHNGGIWSGGQFWEQESALNFFLTYPEVKSWNTTNDFALKAAGSADNKITGFKVADKVAEQKDYVVAYKNNVAKTNDAIPATLNHILSQIEVKAKSTNTLYTYEITGVRIGKAKSTANYTFPTDGTAGQKFGSFEGQSTPKTYEYCQTGLNVSLDTNTGAVKDLLVAAEGNPMLIPQSLTAWNGLPDGTNTSNKQYLSIKVKVTKNGETKPYYNGWAAVGISGNWEAGKKYIYTLDLTNGVGKVDPDGPGPDQVEKPKEPGEDIMGGEIKFNVDVQPWVDSATDIKM